ncbi:MAG: hypothetical protein KF774_06360 [Planctomyces sp.]|nr:hypothetical protein [Planctomyces sp.]
MTGRIVRPARRPPIRAALGALLFVCSFALATSGPTARASVPRERPLLIVVVGAPGTEEYDAAFRVWSERWQAAADAAGAEFVSIGLDSSPAAEDRETLQQRLADAPRSSEPLWLVLIGHGTFDGKTAKFNLRGPDISPEELAGWLEPIERPTVVINAASSSGPFLPALSRRDRVVITATRSGHEYNFSRLGDHLSQAITDPQADLDRDGQISLLEAFLLASSRVREFYAAETRLATEHSLNDDNGDGLGTPAEWFRGVRATKSARDGAPLDGARAARIVLIPSPEELALSPEIRARRDELEHELDALRLLRRRLDEAEYLTRLEPLLIELGRLYGEFPAGAPGGGSDSPTPSLRPPAGGPGGAGPGGPNPAASSDGPPASPLAAPPADSD